MKKVILGALLVASIGVMSSFTTKSDSVKRGAVADRTQLGTADDRTQLGTADARKMKQHTSDRTQLGTAD